MASRSFSRWGSPTGGSAARCGRLAACWPSPAAFAVALLAASAVVAIALSLPFAASARAQAPDRARAEALARRATERLRALQREADRLASDERTLINDVRKLEIERQLKTEELKRVDADAAKVQTDLDATAHRIAELDASEKTQTPE